MDRADEGSAEADKASAEKDKLAGKRVVILGLARQGTALARFAAEAGARVTVSDLRPAEELIHALNELGDLDITFVLGEHPMGILDKADVLAISGGVPANAPLVIRAVELGIEVTNDSQEFVKRAPQDVIGITGSAGKTTTTALTGVIGQVAGRRTWVGGNIGRPLIADVHKMAPDDMVVQELSSFQLEVWTQSPPIAAILNITPNHLDRHKTMSAYVRAKANILRHQDSDGIAVLSADDPGALALRPLVKGRLRLFSQEKAVKDGAFVKDGWIWLRNGHENGNGNGRANGRGNRNGNGDGNGDVKRVCSLNSIKLRGRHNLSNVLAAVTLADSVGVSPEAMAAAIKTFRGVEHRLELVRTVGGVQFVNDSIATAPERALAALNSFSEPIILLAGGRDKDMKWDEWAQQVSGRAKHVVLFGELAELLKRHLVQQDTAERQPMAGLTQVDSLEEAVAAAVAVAEFGDVILLSPGGTSFDAFRNFEERGERFRTLVNDLSPGVMSGSARASS